MGTKSSQLRGFLWVEYSHFRQARMKKLDITIICGTAFIPDIDYSLLKYLD